MDLWRGFLILLASFGKAVWFFTISTWLPFRSLICTGHLAIHGLTSNLDLMRVRQCASSNASAHPKFDSERTEIKGCHPVFPVITSYHPPLSLSLTVRVSEVETISLEFMDVVLRLWESGASICRKLVVWKAIQGAVATDGNRQVATSSFFWAFPRLYHQHKPVFCFLDFHT